IAGAVCALAVSIKFWFGFDDSLDVVAVHLFGGLVGTLAVGFLATSVAPAGVDGLFYGGGADQLWRQAVAAGAVLAYSFIATLIIALVLKYTIGLRLGNDAEQAGIDETEHAEAGYELSTIFTGGGNSRAAQAAAPSKIPASAGQEG
ncbi:MAG: ammonium transporter, partial [Pseudonocardiaceae bacterium]